MSNYQEGNGPGPEGAPGPSGGSYQDGGQYQDAPTYQGGSSAYRGGGPPYQAGYQGGPPQGETSQFPPQGQQQWQGQGQGGGRQGFFQGGGPTGSRRHRPNIRSTFTSTEFWSFVVVALGILVAAAVTDDRPDNQGFGAADAWRYITWLTIGYMISRGLTKLAGHERNDHGHGGDSEQGRR